MVDWTCTLLEYSTHFFQDDSTSTSRGGVYMYGYLYRTFGVC